METPTPNGQPSPEAAPTPASSEVEQTNGAPTQEQAPAQPTPEVQSGAREGVNQGAPVVQLPQARQPAQVQAPVVQAPVVDPNAGVVVQDTPAVGDDVDVIEKEWVNKAKSIVEGSSTDPHRQNKEVNALKADYLRKRYGKEIKLTED